MIEPPLPIGKPVTLTANWWEGAPPAVGDFVGTERGRFTYEIVAIKPIGHGTGFRLRCSRLARGTEPLGAEERFHVWTWARRDARPHG